MVYANTKLSDMRTSLRYMLNEPIAGFWSDAQLNHYLQIAYAEYYGRYYDKSPQQNTRTESLTYTANARYLDLTSDPPVMRIVRIEDRTGVSATSSGTLLREAGSIEELMSVQGGDTITDSVHGTPSLYWLENDQQEPSGGGEVVMTQRLWLAPIPSSSRSLSMVYQSTPTGFENDNDTTGLPGQVELCIIHKALVLARMQEENSQGLAMAKSLLADAEENMRRLSRGTRRGPGRIIYRNVD